MDASEVQPMAAPTPEVAPTTPESAAPEGGAKLPDSLLKLPAFQGLLVGKPGAVSAGIKEFSKRAEAKPFVENKDLLFKAGFGLYRSLDGNTGVVFNRAYIHDDELKQADQAGQLEKIAPTFDQINASVGKSGVNHPALDDVNHPGPKGFKSAPMPAVPQAQQAPMPAPPASAQRKVMTAQVNNLQPGGPTSGPSPGSGRLLNSILRGVV